MTNWSPSKDSLIGAGDHSTHTNHNHNHNAMIQPMANSTLLHRRGTPFNRNNNSAENFNSNNMDLFSRNRDSPSVASSDESDLQMRLARLSVGSAKPAKGILDDLLSTNEGGKNDYDWLITPPGTPLVPSSDGKESQPARVAARSKSLVRSSSVNKTSRLSVSQSESGNPSTRPTRSSSAARSSISTAQYTNYSNRNTNILNTSSASVSSYIRPSTPTNSSSTSARPLVTRTTPSRGSTPSRTRPSPAIASTDRTTRPSHTTRSSTPSSRPQPPGNLNSPTCRPVSRPSAPTPRTQTPSRSPSTTSGVRGLSSNPRIVGSGSGSRPSSPSPRVRPPPQPINLPDFPHETPPNLRTTLPGRPLSAGRSRAGGATTTTTATTGKGSQEASNIGGNMNITRRHSSPVVTRGRVVDPTGKGRAQGNGHVVESIEPRRTSHFPESLARKPVKSLHSEIGSGFGRNISKKSLDMAIKHMDIRNGSARALPGSTLFPQSIRSSNTRPQPRHTPTAPGSIDASPNNNFKAENRNHSSRYLRDRGQPTEGQSPHPSKLSSEVGIHESSRYDAILLEEDLKNMSWLHSADEKVDDGSLFDNGFEPLPEPFAPF